MDVPGVWKLRLLPFPAGILDLIRYPWVADTTHLKAVFGYTRNTPLGKRWEHFLRRAGLGDEILPRRNS